MTTFEKVTGPKTDHWLVRMVGLLAAVIGTVILLGDAAETIKILAVLSAAAFAVIDYWYALRGRISKVYLSDGFIQTAFIIAWFIV